MGHVISIIYSLKAIMYSLKAIVEELHTPRPCNKPPWSYLRVATQASRVYLWRKVVSKLCVDIKTHGHMAQSWWNFASVELRGKGQCFLVRNVTTTSRFYSSSYEVGGQQCTSTVAWKAWIHEKKLPKVVAVAMAMAEIFTQQFLFQSDSNTTIPGSC